MFQRGQGNHLHMSKTIDNRMYAWSETGCIGLTLALASICRNILTLYILMAFSTQINAISTGLDEQTFSA